MCVCIYCRCQKGCGIQLCQNIGHVPINMLQLAWSLKCVVLACYS